MYQREEYRPGHTGPALNILPYVVIALLCLVLVWKMWPSAPPAESRTVTPRGELAEVEKSTIALFKESLPSVVHINTLQVQSNPFSFDREKMVPTGTGSGYIWDHAGHIVTNNHVIAGADAAQVVLSDQSTGWAKLVGRDPKTDIAVLRITMAANKLRPIPLGESNNLQVGQSVFAIGNPFGLSGSLTTGIVSGLGRSIKEDNNTIIHGLIQTDAAINPGNSGGPLLDSAGRLIGMNTAILSPSGAYAGVGFAIPVDKVKVIVEGLINNRPVAWSSTGIQEAPDQLAKAQGIKGVWVLDVQPDSPAYKAGLKPTTRDKEHTYCIGDVIVAINGNPVHSVKELYFLLRKLPEQHEFTLTVLRDGELIEKKVTLKTGD
jgi:S1-C subfamily serine protease